jgi:DNA-binding MarR family transcriptional regulator
LVNQSVKRLVRRLRRERLDHGVSSSKLNVLGHLVRNGPMTATDLAALDRIQPQSLTRMLAMLEERGLIQREPVQTDRRQVQIMITGSGKALLDRDAKRQEAWLSQVMTETLTEHDLVLLCDAARLLDRLAENSDAEQLADA